MPFDVSVIGEVTHHREGSRLTLEWTSTAPDGTWYQLYLQGALAWWGNARHATVAAPRGLVDGQIGAVLPAEKSTDFSDARLEAFGLDVFGLDAAGLAVPPLANRAYLAWTGFGAAEYRIFEGAGGGFDHGGFDLGTLGGAAGTQVGTVPGIETTSTDGLDVGGFDLGGLDYVVGNYSWISDPLVRGSWNFSVVPYNEAGTAGSAALATVTITAPPRPPAPNVAGKRLTYTYNATTHVIILNWLASPG